MSTLSCVVREAVKKHLEVNGDKNFENLYFMVVSEAEAGLLKSVMEECGNNKSKAAKILGISRVTLKNKIEKLGI